MPTRAPYPPYNEETRRVLLDPNASWRVLLEGAPTYTDPNASWDVNTVGQMEPMKGNFEMYSSVCIPREGPGYGNPLAPANYDFVAPLPRLPKEIDHPGGAVETARFRGMAEISPINIKLQAFYGGDNATMTAEKSNLLPEFTMIVEQEYLKEFPARISDTLNNSYSSEKKAFQEGGVFCHEVKLVPHWESKTRKLSVARKEVQLLDVKDRQPVGASTIAPENILLYGNSNCCVRLKLENGVAVAGIKLKGIQIEILYNPYAIKDIFREMAEIVGMGEGAMEFQRYRSYNAEVWMSQKIGDWKAKFREDYTADWKAVLRKAERENPVLMKAFKSMFAIGLNRYLYSDQVLIISRDTYFAKDVGNLRAAALAASDPEFVEWAKDMLFKGSEISTCWMDFYSMIRPATTSVRKTLSKLSKDFREAVSLHYLGYAEIPRPITSRMELFLKVGPPVPNKDLWPSIFYSTDAPKYLNLKYEDSEEDIMAALGLVPGLSGRRYWRRGKWIADKELIEALRELQRWIKDYPKRADLKDKGILEATALTFLWHAAGKFVNHSSDPYLYVERPEKMIAENPMGLAAGFLELMGDRLLPLMRRVCQKDVLLSGVDLSEFDTTPTALPDKPLPEIEGITFLDTVYSVKREGKDMHHCVGTYSNKAVKGESYLFHVEHKGDKATIELNSMLGYNRGHGPNNSKNRAIEWGKERLAEWVNGKVLHGDSFSNMYDVFSDKGARELLSRSDRQSPWAEDYGHLNDARNYYMV